MFHRALMAVCRMRVDSHGVAKTRWSHVLRAASTNAGRIGTFDGLHAAVSCRTTSLKRDIRAVHPREYALAGDLLRAACEGV